MVVLQNTEFNDNINSLNWIVIGRASIFQEIDLGRNNPNEETIFSIGDKNIDLEFWGGKEKVDGICSVGCQE